MTHSDVFFQLNKMEVFSRLYHLVFYDSKKFAYKFKLNCV